MKKTIYFLLALIFLFSIHDNLFGQTNHVHNSNVQPILNIQKTVDLDSLQGYDENEARQHANLGNVLGLDLENFLCYTKRNFINKKYNLTLGNNRASNPTVQSPCTNVDFETGTTAGWTTTGDAVITSGAALDPYGNFPEVCPGGSFSLKLGLIKLKQIDFHTRKILNSLTQLHIKILETSSQL